MSNVALPIKQLTGISAEDPVVDGTLEPVSFADYGLGGYLFPTQWLQNLMEMLHIDVGLPWVPTIISTCLILRAMQAPFYVKMQRHNIRMHNHLPQQVKIQTELNNCKSVYEKQRKQQELMEFIYKNNINPLSMFTSMIPSTIIFSSFFISMRKMATVQYPSLVTGGELWFTDLSVYDPYYILPAATALSLSMLLRFGALSGGVDKKSEPVLDTSAEALKKFLPLLPVVAFPFMMWQPAAMSIFWITSNAVSMALMVTFKQKAVQAYFNFPIKRKFSPTEDMLQMKQNQELQMNAMKKVERHNAEMKRFTGKR